MKKWYVFLVLFLAAFFTGIYIKSRIKDYFPNLKEGKMKLSSVFQDGERIDKVYTCDGEGYSPELTISDVPEGAKSLVLFVEDPDAPLGLFVHWVLYNIPADTKVLSSKNVPTGAIEGMTNFGKLGYGGPCPPFGTHRYFFKLYALDDTLKLHRGCIKDQVEEAMAPHVLEKTELMGVYSRK